MENRPRFSGVNFNTLRKALYLMFFGIDPVKDIHGNPVKDKNGHIIGQCNNFNSPKYKYIVPMQGNFENPLQYYQYIMNKLMTLKNDIKNDTDIKSTVDVYFIQMGSYQ